MSRKLRKFIFISIPLALILAIGSYFGFNLINSSLNSDSSEGSYGENDEDLGTESIYDSFNFFPKLSKYSFYEFIRIDKGVAVINDQMIAEIINYIINNTQVPEGDLEFNYNQPNDQSLHLTFRLNVDNKKYEQSYFFELQF